MGSESSMYHKGRGGQINPPNPYHQFRYTREELWGIDEFDESDAADKPTVFHEQFAQSIVNKVASPDIPVSFSANPYQGCEHGCVYCYARNSHAYWGFETGLAFEQTIIVKQNAAELLEQTFRKPNWKPSCVMLSGNTDCYQPAERKYQLTRKMLETCLKFGNPVGIITKNSLITRDLDVITALSAKNLIRVQISVTTLQEPLRRLLEPRTATIQRRLHTIRELSSAGVPVYAMFAPMIPGLNSEEMPAILAALSQHGAQDVYTQLVRLNGQIADVFQDWIAKVFPEKADRVLAQIAQTHDGYLGSSRFFERKNGTGNLAQNLLSLFQLLRKRHFPHPVPFSFDLSHFKIPPKTGDMLKLF